MRAKKAFKNLIFNLLQQVVGIITSFILPSLIIVNYGSAINGIVQTIKQFMSFIQLTGAGIASSATYAMYKPLNEKNHKEVSGIYNAVNVMFIKAGNIFSLVVLIVSIAYPLFVKEDISFLTIALLVIVMSVAGGSEFYVFGKYQTLLNADQNNYVVAIAQAVGNLCNIIVAILLIYLKQSIVVVQLGASIIYVMRTFILHYFVKKHYQFLDPKVKPMAEKIQQKNDAIVHELTALVIWNSSAILLSITIDSTAASIYSVYALVFSGLNMICNIVSNAIYASFGDVIAKQDMQTLHKAFNVYEWFYFLFVGVIYTVTFIMIMPFISIFTSQMSDAVYYLPIFGYSLVFVGIANNIRVPARTLVVASGHFKETRNRSILEMVINLLGQIIGIYFFGIYGVVIGALLSFTYRSIDFVIYSNKNILKISSLRTLKRFVINFIISLVAVLLINILFRVEADGYFMWCVYGLISTLIVGGMYLIVNVLIDKESAKDTMNSLLSIVKR